MRSQQKSSFFGLKYGYLVLLCFVAFFLCFTVGMVAAVEADSARGHEGTSSYSRALLPPLEIVPQYSEALGANVTEVVLHVRLRQLTVPLWLEKEEENDDANASPPSHFFSYTGRVYELANGDGDKDEEGTGEPAAGGSLLRTLVPGPTLRVSPGGYIRMKLINDLEDEALWIESKSSGKAMVRLEENREHIRPGGAENWSRIDDVILPPAKTNTNTTMATNETSTTTTTTTSTTTTTTTSSAPVVTWPFPVSMFYTMHHPNVTNMHFHGLHCDPHIDDPFVAIPPRRRPLVEEGHDDHSHAAAAVAEDESSFHEYLLPIPEDHVPGLHWYHAHSHGSVYFQIMGGLFGALVVEERGGDDMMALVSGEPASSRTMSEGVKLDSHSHTKGKREAKKKEKKHEAIAPLSGPRRPWLAADEVPSHLLVFHLYRVGPGSGAEMCDGQTMTELDKMIGNSDSPSQPRITPAHRSKTVKDKASDSRAAPHVPSNLFLVNGQHRPTITVEEDQPFTLRMLYAAGSCSLNLTFPTASHSPSRTEHTGVAYRSWEGKAGHDDGSEDEDEDDMMDNENGNHNNNNAVQHQCMILPAAVDGIPLDLVPDDGQQALNMANHHGSHTPSFFRLGLSHPHDSGGGVHPVTPATVAPTSWLYFTPATRYEVVVVCSRWKSPSSAVSVSSSSAQMGDAPTRPPPRYPVRHQTSGEAVFYLQVTPSSSPSSSKSGSTAEDDATASSVHTQRKSMPAPQQGGDTANTVAAAQTHSKDETPAKQKTKEENDKKLKHDGEDEKTPKQKNNHPDSALQGSSSTPPPPPLSSSARSSAATAASPLTPELLRDRQTAQLRELLIPYVEPKKTKEVPEDASRHPTTPIHGDGHRETHQDGKHGSTGRGRIAVTVDPPAYLRTPPRDHTAKNKNKKHSTSGKQSPEAHAHGNYYNRSIAMPPSPFFHWDISLSQRPVLESKEFIAASRVRPYYVLGEGPDCRTPALAPPAGDHHSPTGASGDRAASTSSCYFHPFEGPRGEVDHSQYHGFVVPFNDVVEAHIIGDPTDQMPHPFHFHVNHFQFISFTPRPGGLHEQYKDNLRDFGLWPGQWRDTIPVLDGEMVVRWRAASFSGEIVYHCHMLSHEDRGMMTSYYVLPPPADEGTGDGSSAGSSTATSRTHHWREAFSRWKQYLLTHLASITLGTILFVTFIVVVVFLPPFLIWWLCCRWNTFGGGIDYEEERRLRMPLRRRLSSSTAPANHSHYGSTNGNSNTVFP